MKLSCLIIDDEPLARRGLREYVEEIDFLHLAGEYDSPLKAAEQIAGGNIHLLFLDVEMPKLTGLQFLKTLTQPPPVIFTTAFPQYALDGFEVAALDYLVKPIAFDRFLKAALKAKEFWDLRQPGAAADYLFIKVDGKLVKLAYDEILYVEALQNYVSIHTHNKKYISYLTFRSLEEFLPQLLFVKTHKSYLVSVSKIDSIDGACVCIGDHHIPISRNLKEGVMEKVAGRRFLKR